MLELNLTYQFSRVRAADPSEDIEKIRFYFYRLIELGVIIPVE